jgi:glutamate-ammonia-ligase adenylyltransferase
VPPEILSAFADAADPAHALTALARVRDAAPSALAEAARDPACAARLVTLLGASPLVTRLLLAEETFWPAALAAPTAPVQALAPPPAVEAGADAETLWRHLRVLKRRRILLIAARDLLGDASLEDTTAALSTLAEDALELAVAGTRAAMVAAHGDVVGPGGPTGFVVLGMGKLGGRELNFSSDVDLVYLYGVGGGDSAGGPRGRLSPREFFARLAEGVSRALHQSTGEGFVFRVDLRLRPDGTNGPIANSTPDALTYYEAYGKTWERAAYLKARPLAGDRAVGEAFLADLEPFVYRRFLDFGTIEDIAEMKSRVEASLASARGIDVKLGRGGIREIEFVIQSLQLVHAGKDGRIRERNSLAALSLLAEHRYLDPAEGEALRDAYRFLRDVEHKIQLVDERQTQVIPADDGELRLARRLGYARARPEDAVARFRADLERHQERVQAAFAAMLYSRRQGAAADSGGRFSGLLDTLDDEKATTAALGGLGFRDLEGSRTHLRLLRDGAPGSPATPRRQKLLREVAPALLEAVVQAPDPDLALRHLAAFLTAIGARSSFLALLAENPPTLRVLVRLFGSSDFLAGLLIRHPEMLDNLVRADLVRVEVSRPEMSVELAGQIAAAGDFETRLDVLRRFYHEHLLRIGINDLEGLLPFHEASAQLTDLADASLDAAWRVAEEETWARFGVTTAPARFVVLGLGKLGGRELTYNSDLDIIFIYVPLVERAGTVGVHEYVTRLAQTLMTTLQVQTREGRVFLIDTRLRPSGKAGPLVTSLDAFARYHAESAQLWERQALIKARAAAGDPELGAEVERIVERFVYAEALSDEGVAEIHRLRMRMERELAGNERTRFNIKTGRGGLIDIEFLVQMLQLRHGAALPAVRQRSTRPALAALTAAGVLAEEDARILDEGYAFLRTLTNRLRIERDQPVEALERAGTRLAALARRLGYAGEDEAAARLLADYARHRERIRAVYARHFGVAD